MGQLHYFLGLKILQDKKSVMFGLANQLTLTTFLENVACKSANQLVHLLILVQSL